jgi:hypothetical protein
MHSPSLPSLVASPLGSPTSSSLSGGRSRLSSLASSIAEREAGSPWWSSNSGSTESGFTEGNTRGSVSFGPPPSASSGWQAPGEDERDRKRRRSDGPPALRDPEESARLKWQAQSRNASFPMSSSISGSASPATYLPGNASTSRQEPMALPPSPAYTTRRDSYFNPAHLHRPFAELSANDRRTSTSMHPPPIQSIPSTQWTSQHPAYIPQQSYPVSDTRRGSTTPRDQSLPPAPDSWRPPQLRDPWRARHSEPELDHRARRASGPAGAYEFTSRRGSDGSHEDRRMSVPQPARHFYQTLDHEQSPVVRRSSAASSIYSEQDRRSSLPKSSWPRRDSGDSVMSSRSKHEVDLGSESDDSYRHDRNRKRERHARDESVDHSSSGSTIGGRGMATSGMDVLAESARRAAAAEGYAHPRGDSLSMSRPVSPSKAAGPKYSCGHCGKVFSRPSSLRIHTYSRECFLFSSIADIRHW